MPARPISAAPPASPATAAIDHATRRDHQPGFPSSACGGGAWPPCSDNALQRERQVTGRLEPRGGILGEAALNDAVERRRQRALDRGLQRRRRILEDRADDVGGRGSVERLLPLEHFVDDAAEGEDVGAVVGRVAARLFRGHVGGRTQDRVRQRAGDVDSPRIPGRTGGQLRQAEVQDLEPIVATDEQVLRLQVAMDDALGVRHRQRVGHLDREIEDRGKRQSSGRHALAQRRAFEQLGDEIRRVLVNADVVDRHDARMVECRRRPRLLLEPA